MASDFLPTAEGLASKRVFINSSCPLCVDGFENAVHLLSCCSVAADCWRMAYLSSLAGSNLDVFSWCKNCLQDLEKEKKELAAMVCWGIWTNRNKMVWHGVKSSPVDLVNQVSNQLVAWSGVRRRTVSDVSRIIDRNDGLVKWRSPATGWIKASTDAAVFQQGEGIAVGCIVRDLKGNIIQTRQQQFLGDFYPRSAELIAIREALSWLKDWHNVVILSRMQWMLFWILNIQFLL
ncbi:uncharacterized protein LOC126662216 isoform X1 [Mercurialis annua]|uniref:uncharacterized protein LOC126662216 isoform X1 n=1 Tax=Mercurialis annua TaxID=3986 RepID=UPI00215E8F9B|nr:uncharacterized protein LOC126662216 isoform X1 [Mercurialis annua]XP_050212078.1 uncharacterized protein LOC126662216 isoform X1 [Mercurialis annua]